jgi:D-alanyl-D-alanine carboxypeptidase
MNAVAGRRRQLLCGLLTALLAGSGVSGEFAGTPAADRDIELAIRDFMAANHVPGLSIGILKQGEVALARGYGSADLAADIAASERTVYPLASLTKQFTATGILLLAQDGKLSLDDALGTHLQEAPPLWRGATIRQLLNHTSGIPDFAATPDFAGLSTRHHPTGEVLNWVAGRPLDFPHGQGWKYSNTNYFLLGMVIEKTSGTDYGAYQLERILRPLSMHDTRLDEPRRRERNRARGYVWKEAKLQVADRPSASVTYSAGGLLGSVRDFLKWQQFLQQPYLLSPASQAQMWTPAMTADGETHAYGFGWRIHRKLECVSHSGHVQGAAAFMASCPKRKFAVVLLANLESANLEPLSARIAEIYDKL